MDNLIIIEENVSPIYIEDVFNNLNLINVPNALIEITIKKQEDSTTILNLYDDPISVVEISEQGVSGKDGANLNVITKISSMNMSGHRCVCIVNNDTIGYCDKDNLNSAITLLGITLNSSISGTNTEIQISGEIEEPSWSWDIFKSIYLGSNGLLTQVVPTTGCVLQVAIPLTPTKILINIRQVLVLN